MTLKSANWFADSQTV